MGDGSVYHVGTEDQTHVVKFSSQTISPALLSHPHPPLVFQVRVSL